MKKYRVALIDFTRPMVNNPVSVQYADGLKNARGLFPSVKVSYSYATKCFTGFNGNKQVIISEI